MLSRSSRPRPLLARLRARAAQLDNSKDAPPPRAASPAEPSGFGRDGFTTLCAAKWLGTLRKPRAPETSSSPWRAAAAAATSADRARDGAGAGTSGAGASGADADADAAAKLQPAIDAFAMIGAHAAASAGIKPRWVKYNFYTSFGGVLAMRAEVGALVVAARAKRAEDGGPRARRAARALAIEAVKVVNAQPLALVLPSHMSHRATHRRGAA